MATSTSDTSKGADSREDVCLLHGSFMSKRLFRERFSSCPTCAAAAEEQRAAAEAAAQEAARSARRRAWTEYAIAMSGLVGRQTRATFDSFLVGDPKQAAVVEACRAYAGQFTAPTTRWGPVEVPTSSLWLIGPPGTGKTHLGAAMVNDLIGRRILARMHSAREVVRLLRSTWSKDAPPRRPSMDGGMGGGEIITEEEMINDLGTVPLLVLDEIGVGFGSDAEHVQLFDVLDLRYKNELPTVLLSNLSATALKPVLGDRVFDRLREGAVVKPCNWGSYRGEFAKANTVQSPRAKAAESARAWWMQAGFANEAEANEHYCYAHNFRQFREGQSIGPATA